jgi:dolichol-phosphate mannosyltransferase
MSAPSLAAPLRLSVAAPAYNEAAGIEAVVSEWHDFLQARDDIAEFEIVICNDGSKDGTGEILDRLAQRYRRLRPIHFSINQGAAAALTAAIAATKGDWVLLLDSDGQFPIANLSALIGALRDGGGRASLGVRRKKDAAFARFGSWASGHACNLIHKSHLSDFNSACKLVWGPSLRGLGLEAKGLNYSTEITSRLLECGVVPVEVEIEHRPRQSGVSSMKLLCGARDRMLFVAYIGLRQLLLRLGILVRPKP